MKKRTEKLPIKPYLKLWLIHRHGYKDFLEVDKIISRIGPSSKIAVYKHFKSTEGMEQIHVKTYYPDREKLYYLHSMLEYLFNYEMLAYMRMATTMLRVDAKFALREYLRLCRISEHELMEGTAYKRWQRDIGNMLPGMKCA